jgi:hypothetical protein
MTEADLGGKALWTLIPAGAIYGVAAVLVFRRFTDRPKILSSVNRILAHLMELGLFLDSPPLVLRAQVDLMRQNIRLLRLVILPGGILSLLFALLYVPLSAVYGNAPLPVGAPSVVTIQMKDRAMPAVQLEEPAGIVVETPGVRVLQDRQISWRVRALRESTGEPRFRLANRVLTPGLTGYFLRDPDVRSIEIGYPKADVEGAPWLVWFVAASSVSAMMAALCWKR